MKEEEPEDKEEGMSQDGRTYQILVVDDEKEVQEVLKTVLEGAEMFECQVTTSGEAEEALDVIKQKNIDVVIADQKMPGKNGIELLKEVKENHPGIIRILITGYSDLDTAKSAINEAQVNHYLEKPWDNQDIIKTVDMELELLRERDQSDVVEVENVIEAMDAIEKIKDNLPSVTSHPGIFSISSLEEGRGGRQNIIFKFESTSDLNEFSYELKHDQDLIDTHEPMIEDIKVYNDSYIVTLSLKP